MDSLAHPIMNQQYTKENFREKKSIFGYSLWACTEVLSLGRKKQKLNRLKFVNFYIIFFSLVTVCYHRLPLVTIGHHWSPLVTIGYHQLPSVTIGYHRLPLLSGAQLDRIDSYPGASTASAGEKFSAFFFAILCMLSQLGKKYAYF